MIKTQIPNSHSVWARIALLRIRRMDVLAPKFRTAVEAGIAECHAQSSIILTLRDKSRHTLSLDPIVFETQRTNELQEIYFEQGTTQARTADHSWHFFSLSVDVISRDYEWFTGSSAIKRWPDRRVREQVALLWFTSVALILKPHGLDWGGDWHRQDLPHFQLAGIPDSPTQEDRELYASGGLQAVWAHRNAL